MQRSFAFDGFEAPTLGFTSFSEYSQANKKRKVATTEQALLLMVLKRPGCGFKPAPSNKLTNKNEPTPYSPPVVVHLFYTIIIYYGIPLE